MRQVIYAITFKANKYIINAVQVFTPISIKYRRNLIVQILFRVTVR